MTVLMTTLGETGATRARLDDQARVVSMVYYTMETTLAYNTFLQLDTVISKRYVHRRAPNGHNALNKPI